MPLRRDAALAMLAPRPGGIRREGTTTTMTDQSRDTGLADAPTPVVPTPFGIPWSIWFWGGLLSSIGAAFALVPVQTTTLLHAQLPPEAEPWVRAFGLVMVCYSVAFHVAGWTGARTFMRASVTIRVLSPVVIGAMVLTGHLPRPWLMVGALDLAGGIWTAIELAWRPKPKVA